MFRQDVKRTYYSPVIWRQSLACATEEDGCWE